MNQVELFNHTKLTENNDITYDTTGDNLLNILFMSNYYEKNLNEVHIGTTDREKLFSMFIRDPRFGLGRRDLGRKLMKLSNVSPENIVFAGRYDDLLYIASDEAFDFWKKSIESNNLLAKKWIPRLTGKNSAKAKFLAKHWNMSEKQYRNFIKCEDTIESKLTQRKTETIDYSAIPSLAMIKYYTRFLSGEDTSKAFIKYLDDVNLGKKSLNVAVSNVYDIYRNRDKIDIDLFFEKIEKIDISVLPVVDTSGSMTCNDAIGKALSIGHYLAKCSSFAKNIVIPFSAEPHIIDITTESEQKNYFCNQILGENDKVLSSKYLSELAAMYTGDCSNTDLIKVVKLLKDFKKYPEYIVILSDMEFDVGSKFSVDMLMDYFVENKIPTKLVWWNINARHTICPQMDNSGNIFISGYNPFLLSFLNKGFNGSTFLEELLKQYDQYQQKR